MARRSRRSARWNGAREARAIAGNLAHDLRTTRRRRRLTQEELGDKAGLSQAEISALEAGAGARTSIETWVAIGIALERPIAIGFSRDVVEPLQDAGHLAAQELLIKVAIGGGWRAKFEARVGGGWSTDVLLARGTCVVLVEIWNRLDDLGAAVRSSDRKRAEGPTEAGSLWLLVDTVANRAIVRRYPRILRARFQGSPAGWVKAIEGVAPVPKEAGVAWIDVRAGRLRELRLVAG